MVMWAVASPYYMRIREIQIEEPAPDGTATMTWDDLKGQLDTRRPEILLSVGTIGLLLLVWLMVIKPGGCDAGSVIAPGSPASMWISRRVVGLTVFAFTVVSACASAGPSSVAPSTSPSPGASAAIGIAGPTWIVTTIGGSDTLADARPTMTFGADGQVQGSGGCNSYGGPYKLDGAAIDVGDLASTMMLCQDQSIGAQETAFFAALGGAQTWQVDATGEPRARRRLGDRGEDRPGRAFRQRRDGSGGGLESRRDGSDSGLRPPSRRSSSPRTAACQDSPGATRSPGPTRRMEHAHPGSSGHDEDRLPAARERGRVGLPGGALRRDGLGERPDGDWSSAAPCRSATPRDEQRLMRLAHVRERHAPTGAPWRLAVALTRRGWIDLELARRRAIARRPAGAAARRVLYRQPITTLDDHLARGLRVAALGDVIEAFEPRGE